MRHRALVKPECLLGIGEAEEEAPALEVPLALRAGREG